MGIKYKSFSDDIFPFELHGDWYDIRMPKDFELKKGTYYELPLGVAIKLPKNYEALIALRSSSFKRYGIMQVNGLSVIDNAYCGNDDQWKLPIIALKDCEIKKGDRVCQFRLIKNQPFLDFAYKSELSDTNRGGLGSTGS